MPSDQNPCKRSSLSAGGSGNRDRLAERPTAETHAARDEGLYEHALLQRVRLDCRRRQNDRRLQYQEFRVKSRRETLIIGTPVPRVVIHETPPSEPSLAGDSETGSIPLAGNQDVVQYHTLHKRSDHMTGC